MAVQAAQGADAPLQLEQGTPQGPSAGPGAELALTLCPASSTPPIWHRIGIALEQLGLGQKTNGRNVVDEVPASSVWQR